MRHMVIAVQLHCGNSIKVSKYQVAPSNIGANCPGTSGTVLKLDCWSSCPVSHTDLAKLCVFLDYGPDPSKINVPLLFSFILVFKGKSFNIFQLSYLSLAISGQLSCQ